MSKKAIKKFLIGFNLVFFLSIPFFLSLNFSPNVINFYDKNSINIANSEVWNFTRAVPSGPMVLDPVDCWERAGTDVIRQVTETLWFYNWSDPDLPRINMLAESETWLNSTALEVNLRQGVLFQDGTDFNATAVKWNIDRLMYLFNHSGLLPSEERIATPHSLFEAPDGSPILAGFEVKDTYKGIIHLAQNFTSLMDLFCFAGASMISPTAHVSEAQSFIDLATGDLVGTGPYMYDYFTFNTEVRFSRWDNYWRDPAFFDEMVFEIITNSINRNNAMLDGDVDYLSGINLDFVDAFKANPNITFHESGSPGLTYWYLCFNNEQINASWRKAMSFAYNYSYIIQDYWNNTIFRSYGPVSPGFGEWYNSSVESLAPYYNLTIARQTLIDDPGIDTTGLTANNDPNDAAWLAADIATFNYSYNNDDTWRSDLYVLLNDWFDKIGITVLDGGTTWYYFILRAYGYVPGGYDDLQIFWIGWGADYLDPINMIQPLLSNISISNAAQVNDPKLEQIFVNYLMETDHSKKIEMIYNISKYFASELYPHIYGYHPLVQTCHSIDIYNVPYDLNRYTFYAYPIKPALPLYPQIISSGDITFLEGETGYEINWYLNATELHNPMYYVYRDTEHLLNDTWGFDESVNISLNGLPVGQYSYRIVVQNGPYSVENYVNVEVGSSLEISHPPDITYTEGSTGNNIIWYVNNGYEQDAIYYIYDEEGIVQTDSWEIAVPIILNVDDLSIGTYSYRIEVHNTLEYVEDEVEVNVFEAPPQISINSPIEDETFGSSAPDYNISIVGSYDTIWYTIDDGITNITISGLTGTIDQTEWDKKGNEIVTIKFYANNSAGLIGTSEVSVIKQVTTRESPAIPGYTLIVLVSIAIVTTITILKKKFKK